MERHNLIETRIREMIEEGTLLVDVTGERVGQVNGLSVMEIGGYSFGKPVRITASAALGKAGIAEVTVVPWVSDDIVYLSADEGDSWHCVARHLPKLQNVTAARLA